jgi:hypothetical protein
MLANIHSMIDLNQGQITLDSIKEHLDDFSITIHLESHELLCVFKKYIKDNLDIDLDMLDVLTILDLKSKKIVLDVEELEENDRNELFYLIDEFRYHFGKSIFDIRTSINTNVLFRRLLGDFDEYRWEEDGSLDIEYSLYNITKEELDKYINIQ